MKEYNVDLVMMNGGDIPRSGWAGDLVAPNSAMQISGPVFGWVFGDLLGDEILSSCMGIITNYYKDQPAADWNYQFMV